MKTIAKRLFKIFFVSIMIAILVAVSVPMVFAQSGLIVTDKFSYYVSNGKAIVEEWYELGHDNSVDIYQEIYDGDSTYYPVVKVNKIPSATEIIRVGENVEINLSSYSNLRYISTHEGNVLLERCSSDSAGAKFAPIGEWILYSYDIVNNNKITIPEKVFGISIKHCELGYDEINGYVRGTVEVPAHVKTLSIRGDFTELILHEGLQKFSIQLAWGRTPYLKKLVIPNTVTELADADFHGAPALESVTFGRGITEIPEGLLFDVTTLKSVYGCENVTRIGDDAFKNCTNLETIPDFKKLTYIGDCAFMNCGKIKKFSFYEGLTTIGEGAFKNCKNLSGAIVLPDSLIHLKGGGADEAFENCEKITSVHIGKNTNFIYFSFKNCSEITKFTVSEGHRNILESDDALYRPNQGYEWIPAVICYPSSNTAKEYTVPKGTYALYGFSGCKYLETLNLPSSMISLETNLGSVKTINFEGTKEEWNTIVRSSSHFDGTGIKVNCNWNGYSNGTPTTSTPSQPSVPGNSSTGNDQTVSESGSSEMESATPDTVFAESETAQISGSVSAFPDNTVVLIENTFTTDEARRIETALQEKYSNFVAYEITATNEGVSVQPKGVVKATFDIPSDFDLSKVTVLYLSKEGKIEELNCSVNKETRKITAELSHFSTYIVAEREAVTQDLDILSVAVPASALVIILVVCVIVFSKKKKVK